VALAAPEDDAEVRALLQTSAFAGDVRLSLEREPDSALAGSIEGDVHQTIVARDPVSGTLVGIASRSVRSVFVNGRIARAGYLGQLRVHERFRRRDLLDAGFEFCRRVSVSGSGAAPVYLAAVVADNAAAKRLLARRSPGWPSFRPVDTLVSLAIPATGRRRGRALPDLELRQGSPGLVSEIVSCLQRYGPRWQFAPSWTAADLTSDRTRGLALEDFVLASIGGRSVGCAACWDQRAFKQVVVRGYSRRLARARRLVNLLAPITGTPALPPVGTQLSFAYVSHVAVEHDGRQDVGALTIALVNAVCERARTKGVSYVVLGLPARSPELQAIRRAFRHRAYESVLYTGYWPEGERLALSLDGRPSNPELAIL
jgi:hypothetical protein